MFKKHVDLYVVEVEDSIMIFPCSLLMLFLSFLSRLRKHPATAIIFVGSLLTLVFGVLNLIVAVASRPQRTDRMDLDGAGVYLPSIDNATLVEDYNSLVSVVVMTH